jgi:hypothetical protein
MKTFNANTEASVKLLEQGLGFSPINWDRYERSSAQIVDSFELVPINVSEEVPPLLEELLPRDGRRNRFEVLASDWQENRTRIQDFVKEFQGTDTEEGELIRLIEGDASKLAGMGLFEPFLDAADPFLMRLDAVLSPSGEITVVDENDLPLGFPILLGIDSLKEDSGISEDFISKLIKFNPDVREMGLNIVTDPNHPSIGQHLFLCKLLDNFGIKATWSDKPNTSMVNWNRMTNTSVAEIPNAFQTMNSALTEPKAWAAVQRAMGEKSNHLPESFLVRAEPWFERDVWTGKEWIKFEESSLQSLSTSLSDTGSEVFVKPSAGSGSKGIEHGSLSRGMAHVHGRSICVVEKKVESAKVAKGGLRLGIFICPWEQPGKQVLGVEFLISQSQVVHGGSGTVHGILKL